VLLDVFDSSDKGPAFSGKCPTHPEKSRIHIEKGGKCPAHPEKSRINIEKNSNMYCPTTVVAGE